MPHEVDIHVGQKLKQARVKRRFSQTDVARQLKLSFQQIQKYEIGSNRISASRLYELSKVLDVSIPYFFEGLDDTTDATSDEDGDIVQAVSMIQDEQLKSRIISFIHDVAGSSLSRSA